nr:unnamed protein product [Callosobruchus chinensis]
MKLFLQLISLFVLFYVVSCQRRRCPANFCDNIQVNCLQISTLEALISTSLSKTKLDNYLPTCSVFVLELQQQTHCIVCQFGGTLDEGGDCSNPWETTCAAGLKCNIRGICEK